MGRGRAPCCDKSKVKRGPWSPAEDLRLITFIQKHGHGNWRSLPKQAGLLRCGKSCRLRWINYLRPDVKRGNFNKEEEETIIKLHQSLGNKWSKIASYLPGRTDNEIKNVWNTHLKKRVVVKKDKDETNYDELFSRTSSPSPSPSPSSSSTSSLMSSYGNEDIGDQGLKDQGSLTKTTKPDHEEVCKEKKQDEPKELASTTTTTSSSFSSYASDYSNSTGGGVIDHDSSMTKEEVGCRSLFNFGGPCVVGNAAPYEVIKNHNQMISSTGVNYNSDDQVIEIPLESDIDFWGMLDNLDTPLHSSECQQPQEYFEASQSSNFGELECEHREIECREWLKYLEKELELEATSDGGHNSAKEAAAAGQLGSEKMMMMLRPEIDHAKCYFPTWDLTYQMIGSYEACQN